MPRIFQYTNEFKDQAVRFVFESIEPTDPLRRLSSFEHRPKYLVFIR